jgi:glutamate formiminotransferase
MSLIEAIPNVSEGRRTDAVQTMAQALTHRAHSWLLDTHSDASHHRSVITAALAPEAIVEASCALVQQCVNLIDLNRHEGVHPRMGALDVLPFVPLRGFPANDTIELARSVASELARRFGIPIFLYGRAATRERAPALHELRRGGLVALQKRLDSGELVPDYGPRRLHRTAGATAVGVRDFLIAYNIALKTTDVGIARAISRAVRESSGGLPAVQALGMALPHRDLVQVSMNLTDLRRTSLKEVFDAVRNEADALQIEIDHSEIVGLIPAHTAFDDIVTALRLEKKPGILEERLKAVGAAT